MSGPGRPRILDDAKRREVCSLVLAGFSLEAAARYVGCSPNTIRREALRNEDFRHELRGADVQGQITPLQAMRRAAGTHWRAAAWLLERTNPDRFAPRRQSACSPQDLLKAVDAVIDTAVEEIHDEEVRERLCRRLIAAAHQSLRRLVEAERLRLNANASPFDPPKSASESGIDDILADIDRKRRAALRTVFGQNGHDPKSQKSA